MAVTDDDHEEMTTDGVLEAYAIGLIDEQTFVWREGMDDWATPFDIPELGRLLAARGFQASQLEDELDDEADDATVITNSPFDAGSGRISGWREPGSSWVDDEEASFDDVTVSVDAEELLRRAALERASHPGPDPDDLDEEMTVALAAPSFMLDPPASRPGSTGYADDERDVATVAVQLDAGMIDSYVQEARARAHSAGGVDFVSHHPDVQEPEKPIGARNESSVLFTLDAIIDGDEPADEAGMSRPSDVLGLPGQAPPEPAAPADPFPIPLADLQPPGDAPIANVLAPNQAYPPSGVPESVPYSRPQPKKKGRAGLWIGLFVLLLLLGGLAGAAYYFQPPILFGKGAPLHMLSH